MTKGKLLKIEDLLIFAKRPPGGVRRDVPWADVWRRLQYVCSHPKFKLGKGW